MAPVSEDLSRSAILRERRNRLLKKESARIKTFSKWPVPFLKATDLAKDGFYFTNVNDVVKCAFCKTEIGVWKEGDDPHEDHLKFSPHCPLLRNEPCGNVALSEEAANGQEDDEPASQDICGMYPLVIRPFSGPERPNNDALSIDSSNLWKEFEALGVRKLREPVTPKHATFESRLKTFSNWTAHEIQSPEKLAEAGFYYTGEGDNVLCFHCGGGLKDWEKGEDPWMEHARWFHKCYFVLLQKGKDFIQEVLLRKKALLTAETVREMMSKNSPNVNSSSKGGPVAAENSQAENTPSSSCSSKTTSTGVIDRKSQGSDNKEIQLCTVCFDREREQVFLPCGHCACCSQCVLSLSKCSICGNPFEATIRVYL